MTTLTFCSPILPLGRLASGLLVGGCLFFSTQVAAAQTTNVPESQDQAPAATDAAEDTPEAGVAPAAPTEPRRNVVPIAPADSRDHVSSTASEPPPNVPGQALTPSTQHLIVRHLELQATQRELDEAREARPNIALPVILSLVGLTLASVTFADGVQIASQCPSCMEEARPTFVKSGVFAAATVGGIAWWIIAAVARAPHNEKIKKLTAERDRMKLDLKADQDGALGTLQLRF